MPNTKTYSIDDARELLLVAQNYGFFSDRNIDDLILHSTNFIKCCPEPVGRVIDLGAGGGLPSLVWLAVDPRVQISALDAMNKRCDFLRSAIEQFPVLENRFEVLEGRAEDLSQKVGYKHKFSHVIARGFASPAITSECATGFLKIGGTMTISGRPENEEDRWNQEKLEDLGFTFNEVIVEGECHAASLTKTVAEVPQYPRRTAKIKKQPLWV